jgi:hypothetical protein
VADEQVILGGRRVPAALIAGIAHADGPDIGPTRRSNKSQRLLEGQPLATPPQPFDARRQPEQASRQPHERSNLGARPIF